ncbi:ubiquinol-cytochrome-c reductase complex assembly factor 2 [Bradysia coprophila]|uniref:ubiquinol-cytochrome-c reductase complex assembly factor 2 n=1 Tax=Bradysia coprophila TaxID=38358 RepID=UPI00187DA046|nr:ubiquinol-cytochrome-c reductase complex assembly factor 2 [Bradysia coprophila]
MSVQYNRFLKLLERWPVDKTKAGRDLGAHLREHLLKTTLGSSTINTIDSEDLDKQFEALERLSRSVYAEKYQRQHSSTASGLTPPQCSQILSNDFLKSWEKENSK